MWSTFHPTVQQLKWLNRLSPKWYRKQKNRAITWLAIPTIIHSLMPFYETLYCFYVSSSKCADFYLVWSGMMDGVMNSVRTCDRKGHLVKAERSDWWTGQCLELGLRDRINRHNNLLFVLFISLLLSRSQLLFHAVCVFFAVSLWTLSPNMSDKLAVV